MSGGPSGARAPVYAELRSRLLRVELGPGTRLSVTELAQALDAAPDEVVSALDRLVREQVVLVEEPGHYRVAPMTVRAARELFHLRSVLEGEAAGLAATGEVEAVAFRRIDVWARTPGHGRGPAAATAFLAGHADFHVSLARAGGNDRLADALAAVVDELARYLHLAVSRLGFDDAEAGAASHAPLLDAVKRGDAEGARALARAHVANAQKLVLDALMAAPVADLVVLRHDDE